MHLQLLDLGLHCLIREGTLLDLAEDLPVNVGRGPPDRLNDLAVLPLDELARGRVALGRVRRRRERERERARERERERERRVIC
jgi:hypothetical protein